MSKWNADHYLKFGDERTRAAVDLAARIKLDTPATIADLGCGPGNSTQILRDRWPNAEIVGVDNSPEMLQSAKQDFPAHHWLLADISAWSPASHFDLLYSNAALQWIPNHNLLVRQLFKSVAPGGVFAFQIPSSTYALVRTLIHEISRDSMWNERMKGPRNALTMENPGFYYDSLASQTSHLDIWEAEYHHVMDSKDAIVDWIASTGLRPFLAALDDENERNDFLGRLQEAVNNAYEARIDGKVLYPFRRTFVIAYRYPSR